MAFNTPNKQAIRRVWDGAIIARRCNDLKRALYYFGLPGEEMHDIVDWITWLQRDVTAVEKDSPEFFDRKSQMEDIAIIHDLNLEVRRGKIESIIATGRSQDQEVLRRASFQGNQLAFSYDLVNLDYIGGNTLSRQRAVEALFRAQSAWPFTLLITYNVRTPMIRQMAEELINLRGQIDPDGDELVSWYESHNQETARLKATVPTIIAAAAASARLDCHAYPPVRYLGDGNTTLVHFAFDLTPRPAVHRGRHTSMRALMTLPMIDVINGILRVSDVRDPSFSDERCSRELEFLSDDVRRAIIATMH
jgi:hypothetical protein